MTKKTVRMLPILLVGLVAMPFLAAAADETPGQAEFVAQKCNMCHAVEKAGIEAKTKSEKMKGPDLSKVADQRDADWIQKYVLKEVKLNDADHKASWKGDAEQLKLIADWLVGLGK